MDDQPGLIGQINVAVAVKLNAIRITFGPLDLPTPHDHHLVGMPRHTFTLPRDMTLVGFTSSLRTKDGTPLPPQYLHHITVLNLDKEKGFCPGAPQLVAGSGMEMTEARFPSGYGVPLKKGTRLMALAAFYHDVPPVKDVMATFTMKMAPDGVKLTPLNVYHVSVTLDCYRRLSERPADETDEGVMLTPGLLIRSAPVKFREEGCVKAAYPHGHDYLVLITLDNRTTGRTLLRTAPQAAADGRFLGFPSRHVYNDARGLAINGRDEYEMTMVYHHPLHENGHYHGMGNYLLYLTPGPCF